MEEKNTSQQGHSRSERNNEDERLLDVILGPDVDKGEGWEPQFTIPEAFGQQYDISQYLLGQGRYRDSLEISCSLLQEFPEHPYILNQVCVALSKLGEYHAALEGISLAFAAAPSDAKRLRSMLFLNLGSVLCKRGELLDGGVAFQEAARLDPNSSSAYANLGRLRARERKFSEAIPYLERVLEIETASERPSSALVGSVMDLTVCYRELGDTERAQELCGKLKELRPKHASFKMWNWRTGEVRTEFYNRDRDG